MLERRGPGLFGPGSMAWHVNGEAVVMLGGPRALLMQIAHPSVAAGVAQHSDFPHHAYARLWRTMDLMLAITFGDAEEARRATEQIAAVHRRVHGRTAAGKPYRAEDPELLLWVHATIVDTAIAVHRRYLRPLSAQEEDRYYWEMKRLARAVGVPGPVLPHDAGELHDYVEETVEGLEVTGDARRLARSIVRPPMPLPLRSVARAYEMVTADLLPPRLREAFGIRWNGLRAGALGTVSATSRALLPLVPGLLRRWPRAWVAERRARAGGLG